MNIIYTICHPDNDGDFLPCFNKTFASIQAAELSLSEFLLRDTVGYVRGDFKILGVTL
jgi:hypothetical protein